MIKRFILLLLLLIIASARLVAGQDETPDTAEGAPEPDATPARLNTRVERFEPLFFTVDIDPAAYTDPFDPDDIELIGIFEAPSGEQHIIPGFWMQPYEDVCNRDCEVEDLQPVGDPVWQVRFTPGEVGTWSYTLQVRDEGSVRLAENGSFEVIPSDRPGFIRVGPNPRYFQYSNGRPYFIIGHNLNWSWAEGGGLYAYERWLDSLRDAGGNYARLIIDAPWFIGLEWDRVGDYTESQDDAARLDAILTMAEERGIALQLVLLWHQALRTYTGPPVLLPSDPPRADASADWDDNPYNRAHGGPLSNPTSFFVNQTAQDLFRRRLRYIIARWGYSPQVFAWELIDQIDRVEVADAETGDRWLRDMASYVKQIDEHDHLVTAGSREFMPLLATNPLLDFMQARYFQRLPVERTGEYEASVIELTRAARALNDEPLLIAEHSLNPWFEPTSDDPTGVHFQNALWAAALGGAGGGAVSAWGDTYVIHEGLERYYAPLAAFTAGIDWPRLDLQPAEAALLIEDARYEPLTLSEFRRAFRAEPERVATRQVSGDGVFPPLEQLSSYLYGRRFNAALNQPQVYSLTLPVDSYVEFAIRSVSTQSFARLAVRVDGDIVAEIQLSAGSRQSRLRLPLRAGEHTVSLENNGEDWLELDSIVIGSLIAPARSLTLRDASAGIALSWLQHRDYTWDRVAAGIEREPLAATYRLEAMPPGRYIVQIWDPLTGALRGEEVRRVRADGVLTVELPPLTRQMAIRALRQPDTPQPVPTPAATALPPRSTALPPLAVTNTPSPGR